MRRRKRTDPARITTTKDSGIGRERWGEQMNVAKERKKGWGELYTSREPRLWKTV
jgi:hypothetical protein